MENNIAQFDRGLSEGDFKKIDDLLDKITKNNENSRKKKDTPTAPVENNKLETTPA